MIAKRHLKFLLPAFLLCVLKANGYSQMHDSLLNYMDIAVKNNPVVLQRYNEYRAAFEKVAQVGALPDPELNAGILLSPMELVMGKQLAEIQLMQMFPWFGTLNAAENEMSLMARAKYESMMDARAQVLYDVHRAWNSLIIINSRNALNEKNIAILKSLEQLLMVKFQAAMDSDPGNSSLADLYTLQMEILNLENVYALAQDEESTGRARFNSLLNRPAETPVFIPDTILADTGEINLKHIADSMLQNNPMLKGMLYEQQSAEFRKKMVTRMGYPMIGLGLSYTPISKIEGLNSAMNGKDMIMPMVSMSIPIYRGKYKSMRNEAEWAKAAVQGGYEAAVNDLNNEYYEARQLLFDARRRIDLYEKQRKLANQVINVRIQSFTSTGSGLDEILQAYRRLYDYEFNKIEAVADYSNAVAWLKRLGNINAELP